ncbi:MAG: hypothetical protein ACR2N3_07715 [Pyrinomonadaceae bacterium]
MKGEKFNLQNGKRYIIAFVIVTSLNILLIGLLLNNTRGQILNNIPQNQTALIAKVIPQNDSPLRISIIGVDNSARNFQPIIYTVQNVGNKPIRAYTILGGKVITNSFAVRLLQPGDIYQSDIIIERQAIKEGKEIFLSIDYVEFADGTSWGSDTQRKSKHIAGERAGRNAAIRQVKEFLRTGDTATLTNFLSQPITTLTVPNPQANLGAEWNKGFQRGYKSIISILKQDRSQDINSFSRKLDELEELTK